MFGDPQSNELGAQLCPMVVAMAEEIHDLHDRLDLIKVWWVYNC